MTANGAPTKPLAGWRSFLLVSWPFYLNDFYLIPLTRMPGAETLLWCLDLVFYCLIPSLTLLGLYKTGHLQHVAAAFKKPKRLWLHIGAAILLAFATNFIFTRGFDIWCFKHGAGRMCLGYPLPAVNYAMQFLIMIYGALSAGFLEEIIFRAHLFELLKRRLKNPWAIAVISSALFALIHWCGGTGKLLASFVISLLFSAVYLLVGNLWLPVIWHALHDFLPYVRF